jgi:hypothetical protein
MKKVLCVFTPIIMTINLYTSVQVHVRKHHNIISSGGRTRPFPIGVATYFDGIIHLTFRLEIVECFNRLDIFSTAARRFLDKIVHDSLSGSYSRYS